MAADRATRGDILGLMAEPLQPVRPPVFDHWRHRWMWLPPWWEGDPHAHERDGETLAVNFGAAEALLGQMRLLIVCEHGMPTGTPCIGCRARVVGVLRGTS